MTRHKKLMIGVVGAFAGGLIILAVLAWERTPFVILPSGVEFHIEKVSLATNHVIGQRHGWLFHLRKHLPAKVVEKLTPARGRSKIDMDSESLVVWAYGFDPAKRKYADVQGIRVELIDENGDIYPPLNSHHHSFEGDFSRIGFAFTVFPRRAKDLTLRLVPWESKETRLLTFSNPARLEQPRAEWTPEPLPSVKESEGLRITLRSLSALTNGAPERYWESPSRHWMPAIEVNPVHGESTDWEEPEWFAEDADGNRGKTIGFHEPMIKYVVTAFPKAGAAFAGDGAATLPIVRPADVTVPIQWNLSTNLDGIDATVLGFFPPGQYRFSEGMVATNAPAMGSGLTSMTMQVGPNQWRTWNSYSTKKYGVFVHIPHFPEGRRIAARVRGSTGAVLDMAQSNYRTKDGIVPLLFSFGKVDEPFSIEIFATRAARAEFVVKTPLP